MGPKKEAHGAGRSSRGPKDLRGILAPPSCAVNPMTAIERVSAAHPCEICGKHGWCGRAGQLRLCARVHGDDVAGFCCKGLTKDGTAGMYLATNGSPKAVSDGSRGHNGGGTCGTCGTSPPEADDLHNINELADLHTKCVAALSPDRRQALADELHLPVSALDVLDVGWWADRDAWLRDAEPPHWAGRRGCWTFPERDAAGELVGLSLRFPFRDPDGRVTRSHFGKRGLTLPAGWQNLPDPILCVEGPTDVLAGRLVGLNCVGRFSNSGGADLLAPLLQGRKVVLLGENDRKPDGRWPGRDGVRILRQRLSAAWGSPIHCAFPPDGQKDLRDWIVNKLPSLLISGRTIDA